MPNAISVIGRRAADVAEDPAKKSMRTFGSVY
jgi:hypothetical protein